ncbi:enoyl-CoA delta isomerase 1, mitochondrial-like [Acanthaster planci]|uniref:Enoyl-CoA delta isomerase 1, mitochondrial n=1 Tax=Acanthaster planci TaxID=133434 RepID=A0A8B7YH60_ACAPL|nr:enoyl-CoA delta isomerase 1, mitochondrial-like [Acanthaster planci]
MEALRAIGRSGGCILSRTLSASLKRRQTGAAPPLLLQQKRRFAESGNFVQVERDNVHEAIAIVKMNKKPVNSMSKDFMTEMNITLEKLENDTTCRGVILTSANPGIFSAGLDITEMYQRSSDFTNAFWRSLQDFWMRLYGSNLATVAAVNGHSPAGGCLMAMSCDYRIMAEGKFTMGLNEVLLGIIAPFWFQDLLVRTCGERQAEMALQLGTLFKPEEALKIGMVDEIVPLDDVVSQAREQLIKWLKLPDHARVITKGMCRGPLLEKLRAKQEEDIAYFSQFINKEAIQKSLGRYLESLKKK